VSCLSLRPRVPAARTRAPVPRGGRTVPRSLALAATAAWLATSPARAELPGTAGAQLGPQLILVFPDEEIRAVAERLQDLLAPTGDLSGQLGDIGIARARAFDPEDLFRLDSSDRQRPRAWVVVDGAVVHLRAAGAGRERFVFRDLAVARPLTEIDRERVGQALKSALLTVIDGGPSALSRADAQRTMGIDSLPPASVVETAPAMVPARPPAPTAVAPEQGPPAPPRKDPVRAGLAGFIEVVRLHGSTVYLPGVVGTLQIATPWVRPAVWMSLMTVLPHHIDPDSRAAGYGSAFRAGVSASPAALPWFQLDLGAGFEWPRPGYSVGGADRVPVYRIAGRMGPFETAGMKIAVTLSLERATKSFLGGVVVNDGSTRPGLTLELWWR
jgi:hypothetical protein